MGFWGCLHLLEMSFLRRIIQAVHGKNGGKNQIFFFIIFDFFFLFPAALYGGINGVLGAFAPAGGNWGRQNFPQWFF